MTPIVENVTHLAVLLFYLATLTMGFMAHFTARLWARKWSSVAVIVTSTGWIIFYVFVSEFGYQDIDAAVPVLWSRVFHYNTATWLFIMAYLIWRSERAHHDYDKIDQYLGHNDE